MLQKIRDGASGPLAYIVVGVIAVVFGVWGIGSYFTPSSNPVVASAAGTDITHSQLLQAFNQRYQRLQQMMGSHFDASKFPANKVRHQALESLIDQAVMTHYARSGGYRVTDNDLVGTIRNNPAFQDKQGKFSAQRYKQLLQRAGIKPAQYEAELRQNLLSNEVRELISAGAFATPPEVDAIYHWLHEQRQVSVLRIDPGAYRSQVSLAPGAVKQYYQQHPKQFMQPAKVKLAYVSLDADQLQAPAPDQATLKALYKQHKNTFGTPAKRSAEELRIAIASNEKNADAKARKTVQTVLKAARNGRSFQQIAANTAGVSYRHIDNQPQSALSDAVGSALFGLDKTGALSNPVHGKNAWYVLRLKARTPAQTPPFTSPAVQTRLKAMARKKAVASAFQSKAQKLDNLSYQAPNGLQTISQKLGLKIQHTGWITRKGNDSQGLGQYKAVRKAAFSDAVLKKKLNSKVISLGNRRRVVLRVAAHQPPQRRPLAAVRQTIVQRLTQQKAMHLARQAAQKAQQQATHGEALAKIAAATPGGKLDTLGFVGRNSGKADRTVIQAAFDLPFAGGKKAKPAYDVVAAGNAVALVAVDAVREKKGQSKNNDDTHKQLTQDLGGYNASLEYQALDAYLRHKAKVTIHKNALN